MVELVDYCVSEGVLVTGYSPLGNPSKPPTRVWEKDAKTLLEDETVNNIAKAHNKTPAQVFCFFISIMKSEYSGTYSVGYG